MIKYIWKAFQDASLDDMGTLEETQWQDEKQVGMNFIIEITETINMLI